jgi:hypothetical protein
MRVYMDPIFRIDALDAAPIRRCSLRQVAFSKRSLPPRRSRSARLGWNNSASARFECGRTRSPSASSRIVMSAVGAGKDPARTAARASQSLQRSSSMRPNLYSLGRHCVRARDRILHSGHDRSGLNRSNFWARQDLNLHRAVMSRRL